MRQENLEIVSSCPAYSCKRPLVAALPRHALRSFALQIHLGYEDSRTIRGSADISRLIAPSPHSKREGPVRAEVAISRLRTKRLCGLDRNLASVGQVCNLPMRPKCVIYGRLQTYPTVAEGSRNRNPKRERGRSLDVVASSLTLWVTMHPETLRRRNVIRVGTR